MEEKVEVDYWFIKEILNKKDTTVWVKLNEYTTYTWISINNVLISDTDGNNKSLYHKVLLNPHKPYFL